MVWQKLADGSNNNFYFASVSVEEQKFGGNFAQSPSPAPEALDQAWKSANYGLSIFINQLHQPKK